MSAPLVLGRYHSLHNGFAVVVSCTCLHETRTKNLIECLYDLSASMSCDSSLSTVPPIVRAPVEIVYGVHVIIDWLVTDNSESSQFFVSHRSP